MNDLIWVERSYNLELADTYPIVTFWIQNECPLTALPSEFQDGIGGGLLCLVPVLLKRIDEEENDQYNTAAVHMQGWRPSMEDYTTIELALGMI